MKIFVGNDEDSDSIPRILRLEHKRGIVDMRPPHQRSSYQTPDNDISHDKSTPGSFLSSGHQFYPLSGDRED